MCLPSSTFRQCRELRAGCELISTATLHRDDVPVDVLLRTGRETDLNDRGDVGWNRGSSQLVCSPLGFMRITCVDLRKSIPRAVTSEENKTPPLATLNASAALFRALWLLRE